MRNLRLLCAAMLLSVASCGTEQPGYIRATIDGKPMEFRHEAAGHLTGPEGSIRQVMAAAALSQDPDAPRISLDVQVEQGQVAPGTYSDVAQAFGQYSVQTPAGSATLHNTVETSFSLTLTRIDASRLEGRFSGTLVSANPKATAHVANGVFSVPVEH